MVYENDTKEVRQARENLEDAEFEIQKQQLEDLKKPLQEQIDLLEKRKELLQDEIDAYKEQQDELKKALDASNDYYDNLIKQTEKYWDSIIDGLEKQKSKWEELAEFKEIANAYALIQEAGEELGYSVEDILNDVPGAFEAFRDAYLNVLQEANSGNQNFLDGLAYATSTAKENVNASLTEISNKASDVSTALEPLSDISEKVEGTATALGSVATNSGSAAANVGTLSEKLGEAASSSEDISNVDSSIKNIAEAPLGDTVKAFQDLALAMKDCASALGIGEGEMSAFESAINALSTISLGDDTTGAIGAFNTLASAVGKVTSAIGGGGTSDESKESNSEDSSNGSGSLINAIEEAKESAHTNIGTSSGVGENGSVSGSTNGGDTVISDFDALYGAINNVIEIIGNTQAEYSEDGATLVNAIKGLPVVGKDAITGEAGIVKMFDSLLDIISQCASKAQELLDAIKDIKELGGSDFLEGGTDKGRTGNVHISGYAKGNVHGNAYASGKLGIKKSENALVGEIGRELVYNPKTGTYRTVGDHGPEITRLQKGDLIFNAEQTKAIIKHGKKHGNSYANGNNLLPLSDTEANMFKAIGNALMGIKADTTQMLEPIKSLAKNVGKVTTNNINPVININGTSFTVAGVTGEAVAMQIQDVFAGLVSNAYQRAMK